MTNKSFFDTMVANYQKSRARTELRRELRGLSDSMLNDIGVKRADFDNIF